MANYAIGDIQGCFTQFEQLLKIIEFNSGKDNLWLVGDLVNRGPQSLEVLRWVMAHDDCVQIVLGNHDLHLLAVSEGFGRLKASDTFDDILNAAEGKILLDWLRCQPLMVSDHRFAMVHAGLMPEWTIGKALRLAEEVENLLSGKDYRYFLSQMYGNRPARWNDELRGMDRWRLVVNAMTRMRLITHDGEMNLTHKGTLQDAPEHLIPWFEADRRSAGSPIICGHWSALGLHMDDDVMLIDTGCLWGGSLTAVRLEDRQLYSLPCPALRTPG